MLNRPPKYALLSVLGIVIISLLLSSVVSNASASYGSDAKGLWIFSWQIGGNSNPGTFDVYVKASKSGFESGSIRTSFTVITANGKLTKHY